MNLNSVKLTNIPIPQAIHQALTMPNSPPNMLTIKVLYERAGSPTADNPLNGLFDYTQLGLFLEESLRTFNPDSFVANLQITLLNELMRQGIYQGKFKLVSKPIAESNTSKENKYQIGGSVENVKINHEHFQENQKLSETGNSVEPLDWAIKLVCAESTVMSNFTITLDNQQFKSEVEHIVRTGLARGDALELVIDAIKELVGTKMSFPEDVSNKVVVSLTRRDVLPSATVVIGEAHIVGQQREKAHDKYQAIPRYEAELTK